MVSFIYLRQLTILTLLFAVLSWECASASGSNSSLSAITQEFQLDHAYFEKNMGQVDEKYRYIAHADQYNAFIAHDQWLLIPKGSANKNSWIRISHQTTSAIQAHGQFGGAKQYYRGKKQKNWIKSVARYAALEQPDIQPDVDLIYRFSNGRLEYDYVIKSDSVMNELGFTVDGADAINIDQSGNLVIHTGDFSFIQSPPTVFKDVMSGDGTKGYFVLSEENRVTVKAPFAKLHTGMVIDPAITLKARLGADGSDVIRAVTYDDSGNLIIVGSTNDYSTGFGSVTDFGCAAEDSDLFVTKMDSLGNILFTTIIGGCQNDTATAVAFGAISKDIVVVGTTVSDDFPTLFSISSQLNAGAITSDTTPTDAFLLRLDTNGVLEYSTYLGGSSFDRARGVYLYEHPTDANDQVVYVIGNTQSDDFPGITCGGFGGPVQCELASTGKSDGFVIGVSKTHDAFVFGTYLGGTADDFLSGLDVDSAKNIFVSGTTGSSDLPGTQAGGAFKDYQPGSAGKDCNRASAGIVISSGLPCTDAFAAKLSVDTLTTPSTVTVDAITYFGGEHDDETSDVAVGPNGDVYILGRTNSQGVKLDANTLNKNSEGYSELVKGFPLFNKVQDDSGNTEPFTTTDSFDAFIARFDPTLASLVYSTFLRGSEEEVASALHIVDDTKVYVTGSTKSDDFFPTTNAFSINRTKASAFLTQLNWSDPILSSSFSTLIGGDGVDGITDLAYQANNIALAGATQSALWPTKLLNPADPKSDNDGVIVIVDDSSANDVELGVTFTRTLESTMGKGEQQTTTIKVTNNSTSNSADEYQLALDLGWGFSFIADDRPQGECELKELTLFCDGAGLAAGASVFYNVVVQTRLETTIILKAVISSGNQADTDLTNNKTSTTTSVAKNKKSSGSMQPWILLLLSITGFTYLKLRKNNKLKTVFRLRRFG